jgi:hypothetical protein
MAATLDMEGTAVISDCGLYRYRLGRTWDASLPYVNFLMVNPSTADAIEPDPTITRCINFARSWGEQHGGPYGGLVVTNLFAFRATDVRELKTAKDAIGRLNDQAIVEAAFGAGLIVCAWGAKAKIPKRYADRPWRVTRTVLKGFPLRCLGRTKCGSPSHPLMLRGDLVPEPY